MGFQALPGVNDEEDVVVELLANQSISLRPARCYKRACRAAMTIFNSHSPVVAVLGHFGDERLVSFISMSTNPIRAPALSSVSLPLLTDFL